MLQTGFWEAKACFLIYYKTISNKFQCGLWTKRLATKSSKTYLSERDEIVAYSGTSCCCHKSNETRAQETRTPRYDFDTLEECSVLGELFFVGKVIASP